jgi:hypothetical protein
VHIAEIIYPGTWLDLPDHELSFELESMLRHLDDRVSEAAISLTMFESSRGERSNPREEWERDSQLRNEIDRELREEHGTDYFHHFDALRLEAERRTLARKAARGIVPRSYSHKVPFMHAHSFVYALDSFAKFLDEICDYDVVPESVRQIRDELNLRVPMVRKIRNSALHIEDRSRRYASPADKQKGKRMVVDGFLGLSNLEGNLLCYTIDDGSYQKIAITPDTLTVMTETLNRVLAAMPWKGPPHVAPT